MIVKANGTSAGRINIHAEALITPSINKRMINIFVPSRCIFTLMIVYKWISLPKEGIEQSFALI